LYDLFGRVGRFTYCPDRSRGVFLFKSLYSHPTKTEALQVATGLRTRLGVHLNNEANTYWSYPSW
jgi:hypothetical protein